MDHRKTLIFEITNLKKTYGSITALSIGNLQFHRGTIYGIIGPIGSGKSSLLKIIAGLEKPNSGKVLYDSHEFNKSWTGKIIPDPEIMLSRTDSLPKGQKVKNALSAGAKKNSNNVISSNFINSPWKHLLERSISSLSPGELAWVNMVLAVDSDPRVLILDDYGVLFDPDLERDFRTKIKRMNKNLGTTIILASHSDQYLKRFASVLIYLNNGHISKIRSGVARNDMNDIRPRANNKKYGKKSAIKKNK